MKLLDDVAMLQAIPEQNLVRGQVGTIVEVLDGSNFLVEFANAGGVAYAIALVPADMLLELRHTLRKQ